MTTSPAPWDKGAGLFVCKTGRVCDTTGLDLLSS